MPVAARLPTLIAVAVLAAAFLVAPAWVGFAAASPANGSPLAPGVAAAGPGGPVAPGAGGPPAPWVAIVGPWQLVAPALAAAPSGGTLVLRGTHQERLVIGKPLTLRCEGASLDGGGQGTVVTVASPDVVVDGCRIRGSGGELVFKHSGILVTAPRVRIVRNTLEDVLFGIYLQDAAGSVVEENVIQGREADLSSRGDSIKLFNSPYSRVRRNRIDGGRDFLIWYSDHAVIEDNVVVHGRYGLHFMNCKDVVLRRNRFEDDAIGSYIMYSEDIRLAGNVFARSRAASGFGLAIKESNAIAASRNLFVDNNVGVYLDNSPYAEAAWGEFRGNVIAGNGTGLALLSNVRHNRFSENVFLDNTEQVHVEGGTLGGNDWSPAGRGNFWSDYLGYDADGDGIGDVPYRARRYFATLVEEHPEARLLLYSPSVGALEFAARALPIFAPRTIVQDPAPLIHAAIPSEFLRPGRSSPALIATGLGVLLLTAGLAGGLRRGAGGCA